MGKSTWFLERSAVAAELKRFIAEKCAQVRAETRAPEHPQSPVSSAFFAAAERGDWPRVFEAIAEMHRMMREGRSRNANWTVYPVEWAVVNEVGAALEEFAEGEEKYAIAFARDIISSIPPGSIYFGGTDSGRFLVTALSRSHVNGDPFFTLTQNALADQRSYLRYMRGMYGERICIPADEDATRVRNDYEQDARRRQSEGKLLPGEILEEVGGKLEIRGQISVMAINGLLTKLMFEENPDREFYIEESFPLNWMYPHLSPHGLIMRINRQSLPELPPNILRQDRAFWTQYMGPMIGEWLMFETPLAEVVRFVDKVYLNGNLSSFSGDHRYIQNEIPQRSFSKLRSSIAGLYAWRAQNSQSSEEKACMLPEADFAFRQAFVLCPISPEVVFRYVNLLLGQKRIDEAILLAEAAVKLEEKSKPLHETFSHIQEDSSHKPLVPSGSNPPRPLTQLGSLVEQLKRMRTRQ
ncbi:MAG TPA: hypothetical protein VFE51_02785 [Verrucomicrobiae bacterium]|nr:hypothetical protein [Verrucomicrobiae bacterium]